MYTHREGYFLRLLRFLLLPGGIIVQPEYQKYRIPYVTSYMIFYTTGLCGIVYALFIPDTSKIQIMETVYAMNVGLNVVEFFVAQQFLRKRFLDLYVDLERQYQSNVYFAKLCDTLSHELASTVVRVALGLYIVMNIPPVLIITVMNTDIGDMRALSFPLWCPWRIDNIWKYTLTMGIEVTATASAVMQMFCGIGVIFCYTIAIRCHCEIFKIEITDCFKSNDDVQGIRDRFRSIIMKHQDLMKFTNKIIHVSSYIADMATVVYFISAVMLTSIFLMAPDEHVYALKLISASANLFILFFSCCYIGEQLNTLNHRIKYQIYETQWYTQDIHIQKIVLLFMIQNNKEFELRVFHLYKISLSFLLTAVKNCYSIIQILTA